MLGTPEGLPRLYTPAEVAGALRCSKWWVLEQARRRRVPYCWVAGAYRFTDEHVALVRLCEVQPIEAEALAPVARPWRPPAGSASPSAALIARVPRRVRDAQKNAA
jgi:hypothetical protein